LKNDVADWKREARRILKSALDTRNVSPKQLSRALESIGVDEDPKVLSNKINRGAFSFIFFLQCMRALGIDKIEVKAKSTSSNTYAFELEVQRGEHEHDAHRESDGDPQ
jgi:3-mercaptopyruvate sulfurtransferase SseA